MNQERIRAELRRTNRRLLEQGLDDLAEDNLEVSDDEDGPCDFPMPVRALAPCRACGYDGHPYVGTPCADCVSYFKLATGGLSRSL